jgi:small-conductance mechanosensitive channel
MLRIDCIPRDGSLNAGSMRSVPGGGDVERLVLAIERKQTDTTHSRKKGGAEMFQELRHVALDPSTTTGAIAYGVAFLALALLLSSLVAAWSRRISTRPSLFVNRTSATFIAQLLRIAIFLFAATFYTHVVPALHKVGNALLASAGVVSLVVGLAAQNTLGQLIAGVAILLYRPFEIDQTLTVFTPSGKEATGMVREFTLGYTRLEAADSRSIIIPNSVMLSTVLVRSDSRRNVPPPS